MLTCVPLVFTAARRGEPSGSPPAQYQCNTGNVQCCNTVGHAKDGGIVEHGLSVLGAVVAGNPMVGLSCTPITVVGVGSGASWYISLLISTARQLLTPYVHSNQQTVCCEGNQFNGLVNVGCTPSKPIAMLFANSF